MIGLELKVESESIYSLLLSPAKVSPLLKWPGVN